MHGREVGGSRRGTLTRASPWQNGCNERFNGSVRGECPNVAKGPRAEERPHSSLGYLTPGEFAESYAARRRNKGALYCGVGYDG